MVKQEKRLSLCKIVDTQKVELKKLSHTGFKNRFSHEIQKSDPTRD